MFPCENRTEITAQATDDGNYVVQAISSCEKAQRYVEGLGSLSLIDLTDKQESKVFPVGGSRDATREAFQLKLISDGTVWMDMISSRNKTISYIQ